FPYTTLFRSSVKSLKRGQRASASIECTKVRYHAAGAGANKTRPRAQTAAAGRARRGEGRLLLDGLGGLGRLGRPSRPTLHLDLGVHHRDRRSVLALLESELRAHLPLQPGQHVHDLLLEIGALQEGAKLGAEDAQDLVLGPIRLGERGGEDLLGEFELLDGRADPLLGHEEGADAGDHHLPKDLADAPPLLFVRELLLDLVLRFHRAPIWKTGNRTWCASTETRPATRRATSRKACACGESGCSTATGMPLSPPMRMARSRGISPRRGIPIASAARRPPPSEKMAVVCRQWGQAKADMFSTNPRAGMETRSNMVLALTTSARATSCGVETRTTPAARTSCESESGTSPVPGGRSR